MSYQKVLGSYGVVNHFPLSGLRNIVCRSRSRSRSRRFAAEPLLISVSISPLGLELIERAGIESEAIYRQITGRYGAERLAELQSLLGKLGIGARQLLRTGEDEYKALNLADSSLSEEQLLSAMAAQPKLIERPILIVGNRAVIGRPTEKLLELLP